MPFNKIPKMKWNLEPRDGFGSSAKNAMIRNDRGICAMQDCGNKLDEGHREHFFGKLCIKCSDIFNKPLLEQKEIDLIEISNIIKRMKQ